MNKLSLKLDDLRVESFETEKDGARQRGTVAAHAPTVGNTCNTCDGPSCPYTCGIVPQSADICAFGPPTYDCPNCV